jgi:hypothetical protein
MNTCCPTNPTPLAPPQPDRTRLERLLLLVSPVATDLTHLLFTDRPDLGSTPRTTYTHYR